MGKYKYLFKNIGLLTISNFGTKLLSFFLVPLYTYVLTTEEYGVYDLFNSTVSLLVPLLTLNICEAVLRFSLEDRKIEYDSIFSCGIRFTVLSTFIVAIGLAVNHCFIGKNMLDVYGVYFFLVYCSTAFLGIVNNFTRGIGKISDVSIGGIIGSGAMLVLNIIFLLPCNLGLKGYFLAHIAGSLIQCAYLSFKIRAWRYIRISIDRKLVNEMTLYSIPLIANSIGWWVNNVSDRYIVTWSCGVAATGIYSVAYKIPSILNVFQSIFSQAWVLSAVKEFDPQDKTGFFRKIYRLYNFSLVLLCTVLIAGSRVLARILYANEFYAAWEYVPFLLISVIFGAMSGYVGGVFSAVKNSKIYAKSTAIGAFANIILNLVFVQVIGALGAAIATAISYWIVWVIRMYNVKKYMKVQLIQGEDRLSYLLIVVQALALIGLRKDDLLFWLIQLVLVMAQLMINRQQAFVLVKLARQKLKKK